MASYQCVLRFFHSTCLKYCACHKKMMPGHTKVCALSAPVTQNHLSKPTDLMLQHATPLRKSAPRPPNISDEHVSCTAPATRNASLQILFQCPTPAIVLENAAEPSRSAHFWQGAQSLAPTTRKHIRTSKSGPNPWCFNILTSKCASRHDSVHFFDISTSKSGLSMVCFVHFDFEMCFAPQQRALFRHLNFQKWSEHGAFRTFLLRNVLRATTTCNFSSLIWPDGSTPSAPAALASVLFDPAYFSTLRRHRSLEKHSVSRLSYLFAHLYLLSSDSFSFLIFSLSTLLFSLSLPISAFHLSILSEVWLLNFLRLYMYMIW